MDLAQLAVSRRTVHNYKADKVADAVVERALALSLWAPNHKLTFPWVFFWIGPQARAKLADLAVDLKSIKKPMSEVEKKAARENVLNPSHLILLGQRRGADEMRIHEDYATVACSVQIACLYLWEQGVASKWTTGGFSTHARAYEILGISASEILLQGGLMIGVPAVVPAATERPALAKFLRRVD